MVAELPAAKAINAEIDKKLGPLVKRIADLRPALREMAFYLDTQYIEAFENQGRSEPWKPRSTPNVAGIIEDLKTGTIKERRFEASPALVDTGELKKSGGTVIHGNTIIWGTNVPYAPKHQFGSSEIIENPIPDMLKSGGGKRIERELRKLARKGFDRTAQGLRVRRDYTIEIPARPFVEFTKEDFDALEETLRAHVIGDE